MVVQSPTPAIFGQLVEERIQSPPLNGTPKGHPSPDSSLSMRMLYSMHKMVICIFLSISCINMMDTQSRPNYILDYGDYGEYRLKIEESLIHQAHVRLLAHYRRQLAALTPDAQLKD